MESNPPDPISRRAMTETIGVSRTMISGDAGLYYTGTRVYEARPGRGLMTPTRAPSDVGQQPAGCTIGRRTSRNDVGGRSSSCRGWGLWRRTASDGPPRTVQPACRRQLGRTAANAAARLSASAKSPRRTRTPRVAKLGQRRDRAP